MKFICIPLFSNPYFTCFSTNTKDKILEPQEFQSDEEHRESLMKYQINPNRAMFTIILSIFVDSLGYVMVMPLFPDLVLGIGASKILYGIILSSNAV
ncbi:hypothetical protein LCGC14_1377780 [marine sediment metagenome]|uniref:Uncharacterized protein n=1 Tax=marine sediment metagenome TaxID=412755 RepID=A0A0F9N5B3_9ZZZZ